MDAHDLDLPFSVGLFRYYAEAIDKINDEVAPTPPGTTALIRRVPLGVVGAVVPWNYPVDMLAWKVAPAMAAGNSVVLKPAEQSPSSALRIAEPGRGGRHPRRRPQRRPRTGGDHRPGAGPAPRRRRARLHRLHRGRPPLPPVRRPVEPQAGLARVRRQEPAPGLRRRRRPGRRGEGECLRHLVQPGRRVLGPLPRPGPARGARGVRGPGRGRGRVLRARRPARPRRRHGRGRLPGADRPGHALRRRSPLRGRPAGHRRGADHPRRQRLLRLADGLRRRRPGLGAWLARRSSARCWP
ncbi:aldehyde dehydrogenase family protein [Nocardioides convexus]|uniref:aldehyde dehydrogenase family protein n=1 Tax=Nocardioides convexus TaxID=2712224 RepID=UPI0024185216|nr:aldehyde dehydrogenase family protein [Nocardioides convexus]